MRMSKIRLRERAIGFLSLAISGAAFGAEPAIDPDVVKTKIEQSLSQMSNNGSGLSVAAEGAIRTKVGADGSVFVTLPKLLIKWSDGEETALAPITARLTSAGEGRLAFQAQPPKTLAINSADGKGATTFNAARTSLKGVWSEKIKSFESFDLDVADLKIAGPNSASVAFSGASLKSDVTPTTGGLYEARVSASGTGGRVVDRTKGGDVGFGKFSISARMTAFDAEAIAALGGKARALMTDADAAGTQRAFTPEALGVFKQIMSLYGPIEIEYAIEDVSVRKAGEPDVTLGAASFAIGSSPLGAGKTALKAKFRVAGADAGPDITPPEAKIDDAIVEIEATGLPGDALLDAYFDALAYRQSEPAKSEEADARSRNKAYAAALADKVMAALKASDIAVKASRFDVATATLKMTGVGAGSIDGANGFKPSGAVTLRFTGLDALGAAMEKRGPADKAAQQMLAAIAAIRGLGRLDRSSTIADPAYIMEIKLSETGGVLVNGQNLLGAANRPN